MINILKHDTRYTRFCVLIFFSRKVFVKRLCSVFEKHYLVIILIGWLMV